jgi:maltose O-acetyltransferase
VLDLLSELLAESLRLPRRLLVNGIAAAHWMPWVLRTAIYRLCGLDVAWRAAFNPQVIILGSKLTVGAGSTVNYRCMFDCRVPVVIGQRCGVGWNVQFITGSHDRSNPEVRAGENKSAAISVGDGVWIGSSSIILAGAKIGEGCVIAAGSVVVGTCEPHGLYGGVPARRKRELPH